MEPGAVFLHASKHDLAAQRVSTQQIVLTNGNVALRPVELRYCWPSELDLMARLGGLRLRDRWGGWGKERFDSPSPGHVSVYERH